MLNVAVSLAALKNPEVVARCKNFEEMGDSVYCIAGDTPIDEAYSLMDEASIDLPVVFGEDSCGYDVVIGCLQCKGGRNVSQL